MSKELKYIDNRIANTEFKFKHPVEYYLNPKDKAQINDGAIFKEELETLINIKNTLLTFEEIKKKLQRWYDLLSMDGINSKQMVKEEISNLLNILNNTSK